MQSPQHDTTFFDLGVRNALALARIRTPEFAKKAAMLDALHEVQTSEPFGRACARLGQHILASTDVPLHDHARARFEVLNKSADWSQAHQDAAVGPVLRALASMSDWFGKPSEQMSKQANMGAAALTSLGQLAGTGISTVPEIVKMVMGLSLLTGTATGIANWHAGRDAKQDTVQQEADVGKADYLNMLSRRLREETGPPVELINPPSR